jgi:hypothetical protein
MVDTDNVLLLRAPSAQAALNVPRRDSIAEAPSKWSVAAVIAPVAEAERALELFEREIASAVVTAGDTLLGYFVSETSPNNFPRLPVREDVQVLVSSSATPTRPALTWRKAYLETWLGS